MEKWKIQNLNFPVIIHYSFQNKHLKLLMDGNNREIHLKSRK